MLQAMHESQQELLKALQEPMDRDVMGRKVVPGTVSRQRLVQEDHESPKKDPWDEEDPWTKSSTTYGVSHWGGGTCTPQGVRSRTRAALDGWSCPMGRFHCGARVHFTETRPRQVKRCRLSHPVPNQHATPAADRAGSNA